MNWVVEAMVTGMTAFIATNVDDIVILTLFFARVGETLRRRHIVVGQYLGFLGLILASLPGFLGGMVLPKAWLGWLGLLPIAIGLHQLLHPEADEKSVQTVDLSQPRSGFASLFSPPTYQVAAVTIANGGDNIGIYVPLFANSSFAELMIILSVFLILIGVWCLLGYQLSQHPLLSHTLTRYSHRIVPFVLIALGIFIIIESGAYRIWMQ
ncbi:MAG: cadmium resistance transporter [Oscillatoriales cyanobacterium C42_A2020_001]|nr:cadmium resistance transporter [Leptolyngbyaceae cyanobacterium C42_A2020_001]